MLYVLPRSRSREHLSELRCSCGFNDELMTVRKRLMPIPGKFTMPAKCSNHPGSDHPPLAVQAISLALKFGGVAGVITLAMGAPTPGWGDILRYEWTAPGGSED